MTIENLLVNPIKGSSNILARKFAIQQMTSEFNQLLASRSIFLAGGIIKQSKVFIFLKLFSAKSPKIVYDIIFEFENPISKSADGKTIDGIFLSKTKVKVFSNRPDFAFTYGYAFNKQNLLSSNYKAYLDGKILTDIPKMRNPNQDIGMPSALFYGAKYLETMNFFGHSNYRKFINNKDIKPELFSNIMKKHALVDKQLKKTHSKIKPQKIGKKK